MPCRFEREREGDRVVIRVAGVLDGPSAAELRARVDRERGDLVLDFSLVREFADLGVATLAHGLGGAERRLTLRGLRHHQVRMFHYFGVEVNPLQPGERR